MKIFHLALFWGGIWIHRKNSTGRSYFQNRIFCGLSIVDDWPHQPKQRRRREVQDRIVDPRNPRIADPCNPRITDPWNPRIVDPRNPRIPTLARLRRTLVAFQTKAALCDLPFISDSLGIISSGNHLLYIIAVTYYKFWGTYCNKRHK